MSESKCNILRIIETIYEKGYKAVCGEESHIDVLTAFVNIMINSLRHVKEPTKYDMLLDICTSCINQAKEGENDNMESSERTDSQG